MLGGDAFLSGVLGPSQPACPGGWEGNRIFCWPAPLLLEGLAWVGGLIPVLVAWWGRAVGNRPLVAARNHRWAFMPRAPVSLLLTGPEVSVPPWQPLLATAGSRHPVPGRLCPIPAGQAVSGSVCPARGPGQTDGPIVPCVGSPVEGGTRAEPWGRGGWGQC